MIKIQVSDNLSFMKKIESNTIDLIYCDILYGTGNNFGNYKDLKPNKKDIENHYIPRINEMYRILKETGSIYLQMDQYINCWIKLILDDIFGIKNLKREIIWNINCLSGFKTKANNWIRGHDTIYFYTKSKSYTFNKQYMPHKQEYLNRFNKIDSNSEKYFDGRGKKRYLKDVIKKGKAIGDVWDDIQSFQQICTSKERVNYSTQKPLKLVERIIKSSSNENDLVADFYLGSGTTAVACKKLNRNFIGCDINKEAIEITNKRLQKENNKLL